VAIGVFYERIIINFDEVFIATACGLGAVSFGSFHGQVLANGQQSVDSTRKSAHLRGAAMNVMAEQNKRVVCAWIGKAACSRAAIREARPASGKSAESILIQRITTKTRRSHAPKGEKLTASEIELFKTGSIREQSGLRKK
jgi:hypothetical protein